MKKYIVVINKKEVIVGIFGSKVFDLSGELNKEIITNERLMSWLYHHDALPV